MADIIKREQSTAVACQAFASIQGFEDAQRMAGLLASSDLVPEQYRGKPNLGNAVIALEMANRIGASVLAVMQNLYIVHGRPAWSSQFLISCINASGRFSPLRYAMAGTEGQDDRQCVAWAQDVTGERLEGPAVSVAMAKAEGWYAKNGSKWKTMPELMLRYRAATLFARLYAPELTMGIHTQEEVGDIIDVTPVVTEQAPPPENADLASKLNAGRGKRTKAEPQAAAPEPTAEPETVTAAVAEPAPDVPRIMATDWYAACQAAGKPGPLVQSAMVRRGMISAGQTFQALGQADVARFLENPAAFMAWVVSNED
jgi:hypothetical protein